MNKTNSRTPRGVRLESAVSMFGYCLRIGHDPNWREGRIGHVINVKVELGRIYSVCELNIRRLLGLCLASIVFTSEDVDAIGVGFLVACRFLQIWRAMGHKVDATLSMGFSTYYRCYDVVPTLGVATPGVIFFPSLLPKVSIAHLN